MASDNGQHWQRWSIATIVNMKKVFYFLSSETHLINLNMPLPFLMTLDLKLNLSYPWHDNGTTQVKTLNLAK